MIKTECMFYEKKIKKCTALTDFYAGDGNCGNCNFFKHSEDLKDNGNAVKILEKHFNLIKYNRKKSNLLKEDIKELDESREKAMKVIANINTDPLTKNAMTMHYIQGLSWNDTAIKINIASQNTQSADGIRKYVQKVLNS